MSYLYETENFRRNLFEHLAGDVGGEKARKLFEIHGLNKLDVITNFLNAIQMADDFTVDPNSNVSKSNLPLRVNAETVKPFGKMLSFYLMEKSLKEAGIKDPFHYINQILIGRIYFHDLTAGIGTGYTMPYCLSLQTLKLLIDGQEWDVLSSRPPRWASTYLEQVKETIMCMSQCCTGAISPSDLFICYYIVLLDEYSREKDKPFPEAIRSLLNAIQTNSALRKKIKNDFQRFIYPLNRPFRQGSDSPFTNASVLDRPALEMIMNNYGYFDFIKAKFNFNIDEEIKKSIIEGIVAIEKIFVLLMSEKDPITGIPIRFPVTTLNISVDENRNVLDKDFFNWAVALNKEGLFNIYISDIETLKLMQCCRFKMDLSEIFGKGLDSFGNGGLGIGSYRVCTVNLARCAYESKGNWKEFLKIVENRLNEIRIHLIAHREYVKKLGDFNPLFRYGWLNHDRMFSTFGIVAFAEAMEYFGFEIGSADYLHFGKELLDFISTKISDFVEKDGYFYNLEQIPAEGAAGLLYRIDRLFYNFRENGVNIYSNQFVPLWFNVDPFTKIDIEAEFYKFLSGGGITHINISGALTVPQTKALVSYAIDKGLEHFAVNPVYSVCEKGHSQIGKFDICPMCGSKIKDHITRIVGYFVPVSSWNKARQHEFMHRKWTEVRKNKNLNYDRLRKLESEYGVKIVV